MAGFSIILIIMFVFWPVILVWSLLALAFAATMEFVTSPAFPVLLASLLFSGLALVDVLRMLWIRFREKTLRDLRVKDFKRPAILCGIAFVLFVVMCVMTGSMLVAWYQSWE